MQASVLNTRPRQADATAEARANTSQVVCAAARAQIPALVVKAAQECYQGDSCMHSSDDAAGLGEYGPVLMVQGRYHVVAVQTDDPMGYAVITSAGGLVRRELSLDDAKRWARELAEADQEPEVLASAPSKPHRRRR